MRKIFTILIKFSTTYFWQNNCETINSHSFKDYGKLADKAVAFEITHS